MYGVVYLSRELVSGFKIKLNDFLTWKKLKGNDTKTVDVTSTSQFSIAHVFGVHIAYGSSNICENFALFHSQNFCQSKIREFWFQVLRKKDVCQLQKKWFKEETLCHNNECRR